jgi:predicted nucleotidyltransferase
MQSDRVLEHIFGTAGRIRVLRVLSRGPSLTGRQVAEMAGLTPAAAIGALDSLWEAGVVSMRRVGRANLYELRQGNAVVDTIVLPTLRAEEQLPDLAMRDIEEALGPGAISLVLFGSYARGDAGPDSDVDVMAVVADDAAREAMIELGVDLAMEFGRRHGRSLSVHPVTVDQLREGVFPFIDEARREGIRLSGKGLGEVAPRGA